MLVTNTHSNSEDCKDWSRIATKGFFFWHRRLEKSHGTLTTVARLLYTQKVKGLTIPTMEEWLKMMELADMAKLTTLIREKIISTFMPHWTPYRFFAWNRKTAFMICVFANYIKNE